MRGLLVLATIQITFLPAETLNGVIWNEEKKDFVPIFDIPTFARLNQEILAKSRNREMYDFQGQTLLLRFHQEPNILDFIDDNTKVSGLFGELWNILAELSNFTIKPVIQKYTHIGTRLPNNTYSGLLGLTATNKIDIIPKLEIYSTGAAASTYTLPIMRNRFYIKKEVHYNANWMINIFSWRVWCATVGTQFLFSLCNFLCQTIVDRFIHGEARTRFMDHVFHSFGVICSRSSIPDEISEKSRTLVVSLGFFSSVINMAFCGLLFGYMAQVIFVTPFNDMTTLLDKTSYKIVVVRGTIPFLAFKVLDGEFKRATELKRVVDFKTRAEVYNQVCLQEGRYTLFEGEDVKKARGHYICPLNPASIPYLQAWTASAMAKDFQHIKTINAGILKMFESGLIRMLINRWQEAKNREDDNSRSAHAINMEQVSTMFLLLFLGTVIAVIVLILENMMYIWERS
ncbi:hypothetical protein KM043_001300 [Ampulex compressa]|nr:hypothetical protein KM043_001300 [Ampulex compressa]